MTIARLDLEGYALLNCGLADFLPASETTRQKLSASATLRYADEAAREKNRQIQQAVWRTPEMRALASTSAVQRYTDKPEIRKRLSAAGVRRYADPDARQQASDQLKAQWNDPLTRAKLARSTHVRWHINRGLRNPSCEYCVIEASS